MASEEIPKDMKVGVMTEPAKIVMERRPVPEPADGEVLVKISYVGICGSDLHYFEHGRIGPFVVKYPFVLGHEASGVVVKSRSPLLNPGDRVCFEPGKACGKCDVCVRGLYNLCPKVEFFATPPFDGTFCEFVTHPASLSFKLPPAMSLKEGALIEPLAVGFHASGQAEAGPGQVAAVFGSGCIGLCCLMGLQARGVSNITVTDVVDTRLAKAKEIGATQVVNVGQNQLEGRFDVILEASGAPSALAEAVRVAKPGGVIVLVGYPASGNSTLPVGFLLDKEVTIKTVFRYRHVFPAAIDAVASRRIDVGKIVTHEFVFDDVQNAMTRSIHEKTTIVKSVIKVAG